MQPFEDRDKEQRIKDMVRVQLTFVCIAQVMHLGLLLLPIHTVSSSKASEEAMKGAVFVHYSEYKNEGTLLSHHQSTLVPFVFSSDIS